MEKHLTLQWQKADRISFGPLEPLLYQRFVRLLAAQSQGKRRPHARKVCGPLLIGAPPEIGRAACP
jgi:hypothetical protein